MSFFGATTPSIGDEDYNREREALTDAERVKLQCELYDFSHDDDVNVIHETSTLIRASLALLDEAIDALPEEEKCFYLLAKDRAPELIQEESPPLAFLRCESFDPLAAAKRLCGHWALRTRAFGLDRAFLPMTFDGAMQEDHDDYVEHGFVYPIDNTCNGRVVLFWDRMRASCVPRDVAVRCALYVVTKLCFRPEFSAKGYVVLVNYQACSLRKNYDRILTKQLTEMVATSAGKLKALHLCTGPGRSVAGFLLPALRKIWGYYIRLRVVIHAGSRSDVLPVFDDYGLTETHAQVMYGPSSHKLEVARAWIAQHQQFERGTA